MEKHVWNVAIMLGVVILVVTVGVLALQLNVARSRPQYVPGAWILFGVVIVEFTVGVLARQLRLARLQKHEQRETELRERRRKVIETDISKID
jgi:hypothetical protein